MSIIKLSLEVITFPDNTGNLRHNLPKLSSQVTWVKGQVPLHNEHNVSTIKRSLEAK